MWRNNRLCRPARRRPILLAGLDRLEYRGYDSAGIAILPPRSKLAIRRAVGKLGNLRRRLLDDPLARSYRHRPYAMGHARSPV